MGRATPIVVIVCLVLAAVGLFTFGVVLGSIKDMGYESHEPINIQGDSQFASIAAQEGWSGNGTHDAPYVIEGYQIQGDSCISISEADSHFVIYSCDLSSGADGSGVYLRQTPNARIESCTIHSVWCGVYLSYTSGVYIYKDTVHDAALGLYLDHCNGGMIDSCQITNNGDIGVQLNQSSFCNVSGSTFEWNANAGIVAYDGSLFLTDNSIFHSQMGVQLVNCSQSGLWDNEISYNQVGTNVLWSGDVHFEANTFSHNSEYGLDFYDAPYNCRVYYNRFFDNGIGNARDNGESNTWDDGYDRGNYWNDYIGSGVYDIPGTAKSVDRYPMQQPYVTSSTTTTTALNTGSSSTVTTTTDTAWIDILGTVSTALQVASVAILVVTAYLFIRRRGSRGHQ